MPPEWSLRPATDSDRDFRLELERLVFREAVDALWGWDDEEQRKRFDERFTSEGVQVIQVGGEDAGVLDVKELEGELVLASILLLPAWQGQGIGGSVLDALLERASAQRKPLTLRVLVTNPRAVQLYERKGFRIARTTDTHAYMLADP